MPGAKGKLQQLVSDMQTMQDAARKVAQIMKDEHEEKIRIDRELSTRPGKQPPNVSDASGV
jgi:hypothetical protein